MLVDVTVIVITRPRFACPFAVLPSIEVVWRTAKILVQVDIGCIQRGFESCTNETCERRNINDVAPECALERQCLVRTLTLFVHSRPVTLVLFCLFHLAAVDFVSVIASLAISVPTLNQGHFAVVAPSVTLRCGSAPGALVWIRSVGQRTTDGELLLALAALGGGECYIARLTRRTAVCGVTVLGSTLLPVGSIFGTPLFSGLSNGLVAYHCCQSFKVIGVLVNLD